MNRIAPLSLAAVVALTLSACGGTTGSEQTEAAEPATTVEAPAVETKTTEAPEPEPTTEPAEEVQDALVEFGETWEYEDGASVTVNHVGTTVAGEYAAGAEPGGTIHLFEVTVTNNTSGIMDAAEIHGIVNYGTTVAERVFDEGLDYTFQGKILPGKSMTEVQGYAMPTSVEQEVLFSITPSWMHEDAMFFGTLPAV